MQVYRYIYFPTSLLVLINKHTWYYYQDKDHTSMTTIKVTRPETSDIAALVALQHCVWTKFEDSLMFTVPFIEFPMATTDNSNCRQPAGLLGNSIFLEHPFSSAWCKSKMHSVNNYTGRQSPVPTAACVIVELITLQSTVLQTFRCFLFYTSLKKKASKLWKL